LLTVSQVKCFYRKILILVALDFIQLCLWRCTVDLCSSSVICK